MKNKNEFFMCNGYMREKWKRFLFVLKIKIEKGLLKVSDFHRYESNLACVTS